MELSPEDIRKDKGKILPSNFKIFIFFDDYCKRCNSEYTSIDDLCKKCTKTLGRETIEEWRTVKEILDKHDYPDVQTARKYLTNVDPELEKRHLA